MCGVRGLGTRRGSGREAGQDGGGRGWTLRGRRVPWTAPGRFRMDWNGRRRMMMSGSLCVFVVLVVVCVGCYLCLWVFAVLWACVE